MPIFKTSTRAFGTALLLCATAISGCSTLPAVNSGSLAQTESAITPAHIRYEANRVANWQLANLDNLDETIRSPSPQTPIARGWVMGTFFLGLAEYGQFTDQPAYLQSLAAIANEEGWRFGDRQFHADDHLVGQVYFLLEEAGIASADLAPTRSSLDGILANRPTTQMLHPDGPGDPGCSKRWCWSDALFMAPATWWMASERFDNAAYADFAHEEFVVTTDLLFDEEEGLYYRDSRFFDRRGADGEKLFWSRGNGWVYGGLVNILKAMDGNDPRRAYYVDLFRRMSEALVEIQTDDGFWRTSLLASSDTPPETSGTAFFTYGIAYGLNEGLLTGDEYRRAADAGWLAIESHVDQDGRLGYVQQIGDRPDSVLPDDTQLYGVGAFLLAAVEIEKLSVR